MKIALPFLDRMTPYALMISIVSLTVPSALADKGGGSNVGGGGTVITLADDTVIGADKYVVSIPDPEGTPIQLGKNLEEEIKRVIFLMANQAGQYFNKSSIPGNVLSKNVQYRLLPDEQLKKYCGDTIAALHGTPDESHAQRGGCTKGKYTFLLASKFLQMSLREQAKFILHERMHAEAVASEWNEEAIIATVIRGVDVMLQQFDREMKGQFIPLTDDELKYLQEMSDAVRTYGLLGIDKAPSQNFRRARNGGGIVSQDSAVSPSAYVGIAATFSGRIDDNAILAPATRLICTECVLEKGAEFKRSIISERVVRLRMGERALIEHSHFSSESLVTMTSYFTSLLWNMDILAASGSSVRKSSILMTHRGLPYGKAIEIGSKTELENTSYSVHFTRLMHKLKVTSTAPVAFPGFGFAMMGAFLVDMPQVFNQDRRLSMDRMEEAGERYSHGTIRVRFTGVQDRNTDQNPKKCKVIKTHKERVRISSGC